MCVYVCVIILTYRNVSFNINVFVVVGSIHDVGIPQFKMVKRVRKILRHNWEMLERWLDCYKNEYPNVFEVAKSKYDIEISKFKITDRNTELKLKKNIEIGI